MSSLTCYDRHHVYNPDVGKDFHYNPTRRQWANCTHVRCPNRYRVPEGEKPKQGTLVNCHPSQIEEIRKRYTLKGLPALSEEYPNPSPVPTRTSLPSTSTQPPISRRTSGTQQIGQQATPRLAALPLPIPKLEESPDEELEQSIEQLRNQKVKLEPTKEKVDASTYGATRTGDSILESFTYWSLDGEDKERKRKPVNRSL